MLLYGLFIIRLIRVHTFNHVIMFDHRPLTNLESYIWLSLVDIFSDVLVATCSRLRANKSESAVIVPKRCSFGDIKFGFAQP